MSRKNRWQAQARVLSGVVAAMTVLVVMQGAIAGAGIASSSFHFEFLDATNRYTPIDPSARWPFDKANEIVLASSTADVRNSLPIQFSARLDGATIFTATATDAQANCRGATGCSVPGPVIPAPSDRSFFELTATDEDGMPLAEFTSGSPPPAPSSSTSAAPSTSSPAATSAVTPAVTSPSATASAPVLSPAPPSGTTAPCPEVPWLLLGLGFGAGGLVMGGVTGALLARLRRIPEPTGIGFGLVDPCAELRRRCAEARQRANEARQAAEAARNKANQARQTANQAGWDRAGAEQEVRDAGQEPDESSWVEGGGRRITSGDLALKSAASQAAWDRYQSGEINAEQLEAEWQRLGEEGALAKLREADKQQREARRAAAEQALREASAAEQAAVAEAEAAEQQAAAAEQAAAEAEAEAERACAEADECEKREGEQGGSTGAAPGTGPAGGETTRPGSVPDTIKQKIIRLNLLIDAMEAAFARRDHDAFLKAYAEALDLHKAIVDELSVLLQIIFGMTFADLYGALSNTDNAISHALRFWDDPDRSLVPFALLAARRHKARLERAWGMVEGR